MVDIVEPVSARTVFQNLVEDVGSTYTDADDAYDTWATALGVANPGTDLTLTTDWAEGDFYELPFSVLDEGSSGYILFSQTYGIGLYDNDPSVQTGTYTTPYGAFDVGFIPDEYPTLMIGAVTTEAAGSGIRSLKDLKLRSTSTEVIGIYTLNKATGDEDLLRVAFRIRPGYMELVVTVLIDWGSSPAAIFYAVGNESTDAIDTAGALAAGLFATTTIAFKSDDLGELKPVIAETMGFSLEATAGFRYNDTLAPSLRLSDPIYVAIPVIVTETQGLSDTAAFKWYPGATITELLRLQDTPDPVMTYGVTLAEALALDDVLRTAYVQTLVEGLELSEVLESMTAVLVLERLGIGHSVVPNAIVNKAIAESVVFRDGFRNFFGGELVDGLGVTQTLTSLSQLYRTATETLGLSPTLTPTLVFRVEVDETLALDDAQLINMIFHSEMLEGIGLSVGYVDPNAGFTAWAINTRNGAVTEYDNFRFNSFGRIGNRYLGASADGLYELNGDTDDGSDVIARIRSGLIQFNGTKLASIAGAYVAMRGAGEYILRLIAGDGRTYDYAVDTRNMRSTKVKFGKGLRARYFAFELIGTGDDFDLDTLEFVPLWPTRHV